MLSLVFWTPTSITGDLIAWWECSPVSHVGILVDNTYWESLPRKKLRGVPFSSVSGYFEVVKLSDSVQDTGKAWDVLLEHEGYTYDYGGVASFICPWIKEQKHADFCSEIAWKATRHLLDSGVMSKIKPSDIYLLARQRSADMMKK